MKKLHLRQTIAVLLTLLFLMALAAPTLAAEYVTVSQNTTVRSGASSSSRSLGTARKGETLEFLGDFGTWTRVMFNGSSGYVLTRYIERVLYVPSPTPAPATNGNTVYATTAVNIRSGPGSSYSRVGELRKGDAVIKVGVSGNWTIIEWNNGTAYVSSSYLTAGTSAGSTGTVASGNYVAAISPVNVRSGPGTNYTVLGELSTNETVQKLGTSGNWTQINFYGRTAYVSTAYVRAANAPDSSTGSSSGGGSSSSSSSGNYNDRLYATHNDTAIRNGPSSAYRAIGYLDDGDYVLYDGSSSGNWYKVQFGGNDNAYVYRGDVVFYNGSNVPNSQYTGEVQARDDIKVYAEDRTASRVLGTLYDGDTAKRVASYTNGWTAIYYRNNIGYVRTRDIVVLSYGDAGDMKSVNAYRYSLYNSVPCYSAPNTASYYRLGYVHRNERVWVDAMNDDWAQCYIDGMTMFVETKNLSNTSVGGSYSSGSGYGTYWLLAGNYVYSKGATPYNNFTGSAAADVYDVDNDGNKNESDQFIFDADDYINRNTRLYIRIGPVHDRVYVEWYAKGKTHKAYVNTNDLMEDYRR